MSGVERAAQDDVPTQWLPVASVAPPPPAQRVSSPATSQTAPGPAADAAGPARARDRLYEIDALRILAAFAVVIYHYTFADYAGALTHLRFDTVSLLTRYGYLGVDLFFVISGFVVLLSAIGRRPDQFVISRMVRLYPAFWVSVTITTLVLVLFSAGQFRVTLFQYVANMTMFDSLVNVQNIDVVYWTLWAELRFYVLVFALVCWGITRGRLTAVMWAWLAVTAVLDLSILPGPVQSLLTLALQPEWSHYFIAGMALCLVYKFGMSPQLGVILVASYALAVHRAIDFGDKVGMRYGTTIHRWAVIAIITAIFIVMTFVALRHSARFGRAWFAIFGALTYPLYLVHDRVGVVLFNRFGAHLNRWLVLVLVIAVAFAVAYLVYRFVERPFAPVFKRFLTRLAEQIGLGRDGPGWWQTRRGTDVPRHRAPS
jgi:peptidoglycan/LPS O-acetylase OafA/YrhL